MAMAGLHSKGNSNGNRSGNKPYGMMLLLAFAAALLGVVMIHKLRERRIFSLLVKEKDHQLISLQLLLQREREYTKEMKRKAEEMKAKIYSLRNQNMETDRRIQEMQSTIRSLNDERKILESALEEKHKDTKTNRKRNTGKEKENPQLTALMESLKQKEAEIEDLKSHLKRSSAVTHTAQSNRKPNVNATGELEDNSIRFSRSEEKTGALHESTNYSDGANSVELTSVVKSEDFGELLNTSENERNLSLKEENNTATATGERVKPIQELGNTGDSDSGTRSALGQEHIAATDEHLKLKTSEYAKEKRWITLIRNRRLVNNRKDEKSEAEGTQKSKIPVNIQNELSDREEGTTGSDNKNTDEKREMGVNNQLKVTKLEDSPSVNNQNPRDSKDPQNIPVIKEIVQNLKEWKVNGSFEGGNTVKESSGIRYRGQENESRDMKMQNNGAKENTGKDERQEESEDDGEFYRELLPDLEEDKEEYKEETEEPEF